MAFISINQLQTRGAIRRKKVGHRVVKTAVYIHSFNLACDEFIKSRGLPINENPDFRFNSRHP